MQSLVDDAATIVARAQGTGFPSHSEDTTIVTESDYGGHRFAERNSGRSRHPPPSLVALSSV